MEFFAITFDKVIIRFYLMMACAIAGGFSGQYWLCALALPLFLSAILGVSIKRKPAATAQIVDLKKATTSRSLAA